MTNANPKAEDFNFNPESACQCDHDLALGCPANPGRVYGNDGTVGLCESGEDSPWSPDGPRLVMPSGFAVARANAAKHIINIKDSIAKARNAGDEALARALTIQAKGIKGDLGQLIDLLADF